MERVGQAVGILIVAAVIAAGVGIILAIPVMLLWNWLMPQIFGLMEIGIFQAWGLIVLAHLMFPSSSVSKS